MLNPHLDIMYLKDCTVIIYLTSPATISFIPDLVCSINFTVNQPKAMTQRFITFKDNHMNGMLFSSKVFRKKITPQGAELFTHGYFYILNTLILMLVLRLR